MKLSSHNGGVDGLLANVASGNGSPTSKTTPRSKYAAQIIGYYSSSLLNARSEFEAELIGGLLRGCREEGKNLLLLGAHDESTACIETLLADITGGKIDGLIARFAPSDPLCDRLRTLHFPTVALADPYPGLPSVIVDDIGGFRQVAHYLADQGHRRILFRGYAGKFSAARRRGSFQDVATQRGMTVLEDPTLQTDPFTPREQSILQGNGTDRPTAVVCWTDSIAHATLRYAASLGLHVPGDLAVVGFNGLPARHELPPRLTTICAPWHDVAAQSIQILCELLRGSPVPNLTTLPVTLIQGDTA